MGLHEKIKKLLPSLADDGSKEIAQGYLDALEKHKGLETLRLNAGFQVIMKEMEDDFVDRLRKIVDKDVELREMRKMYVRVMGSKSAEKQIETHIKTFLEKEIDDEE